MISSQPEPHVSGKAITEAITVVAVALQGAAYGRASLEKAGRAVDALISHGWGPQPTVSMKRISEYRSFGILQEYLESKGIKVIDHE